MRKGVRNVPASIQGGHGCCKASLIEPILSVCYRNEKVNERPSRIVEGVKASDVVDREEWDGRKSVSTCGANSRSYCIRHIGILIFPELYHSYNSSSSRSLSLAGSVRPTAKRIKPNKRPRLSIRSFRQHRYYNDSSHSQNLVTA